MEYVKSPFDADEYEALARRAESNLRPVPNEVRFIVREALREAGLLEQPPGRSLVAEASA